MKQINRIIAFLAVASVLSSATPLLAQKVEPGFRSLFNGKDLTGWAGRTNHWSVQDGVITGITTADNPAKGNNFLIAKVDGTNLEQTRRSWCRSGTIS